ncbi:uncharacterized protein LOC135837095 isoform X3 [Planococcus citri]|uniref:uncharacterized protein LOC135837095 isoform X3 n=1 Tax=Planococcus citri TaxID=170843 RepID=UPI0031F8094D
MNNNLWTKKLVVLVILFICEDSIIPVAQSSSNDSTKYDLTNVLNEAILKLLKSTDLVEKLESHIIIEDLKYYDGIYQINNTAKLRPFGNTININYMYTHTCGLTVGIRFLMNRNPPNTVRWNFSKNKLRLFYDELRYWLVGDVLIDDPLSYWNYHPWESKFKVNNLEYNNLSIIATKPPEDQKDDKNISINMSYVRFKNLGDIKLKKHPKLSYKQQLKLMYIIGLELPSMMRGLFFDDGDFNVLLGKIFNLHPNQYIISACPDFLTNEQRYYYLLPDISFVYICFKNITIRGLSNFESFVNNQSWSRRYSSYDFVYTLHIKNVRGNMTLDPGFEHVPHFQLNFFIGNLGISFVPEKGKFRVEAQDYNCIVEDTLQPSMLISSWLPKYSTSIIQLIESALTDSLMPSKKDKENSTSLSSDFAEIETSFVELLKNSHPRTR